MLTVTRAGLAAISNAEISGFKISLTSFKLSEHDVSSPDVNFYEATDLFGTVTYAGQTTAAEVLGTSTVKVTVEIPKELPRTGKWYFREIGLYLDTGELFAIGPLVPTYEKDNAFGIRIYVTVTANRLGQVISVNISQNNSLPVISQIRNLTAPIDSDHSVVAVMDENENPYGSASSGLAVRSGPGLLHWSLIGHHRIYHGLADLVVDQDTFKVAPATGGFWLNDKEIVISQITTGSGAGQTRKMRYNKDSDEFDSLDMPFTGLNETSTIAIWRDNANQLPTRSPDIPEYMVQNRRF